LIIALLKIDLTVLSNWTYFYTINI